MLNYSDTHIGKDLVISQDDRDLMLAEYQPLRDEVNRTIDRLTANEVICGGAVFGLTGFHLSSGVPKSGFEHIYFWFVPLISCLISLFGQFRSAIFRRHLDMVETYLRDMERRFSKNFGWSNFYEVAVKNTATSRQMGSRNLFWHWLQFGSLLALVLNLRVFFYTIV